MAISTERIFGMAEGVMKDSNITRNSNITYKSSNITQMGCGAGRAYKMSSDAWD